MFFRSTASAALRELAVYDDSRHTMHPIPLGFCSYFGFVHVMDDNVA